MAEEYKGTGLQAVEFRTIDDFTTTSKKIGCTIKNSGISINNNDNNEVVSISNTGEVSGATLKATGEVSGATLTITSTSDTTANGAYNNLLSIYDTKSSIKASINANGILDISNRIWVPIIDTTQNGKKDDNQTKGIIYSHIFEAGQYNTSGWVKKASIDWDGTITGGAISGTSLTATLPSGKNTAASTTYLLNVIKSGSNGNTTVAYIAGDGAISGTSLTATGSGSITGGAISGTSLTATDSGSITGGAISGTSLTINNETDGNITFIKNPEYINAETPTSSTTIKDYCNPSFSCTLPKSYTDEQSASNVIEDKQFVKHYSNYYLLYAISTNDIKDSEGYGISLTRFKNLSTFITNNYTSTSYNPDNDKTIPRIWCAWYDTTNTAYKSWSSKGSYADYYTDNEWLNYSFFEGVAKGNITPFTSRSDYAYYYLLDITYLIDLLNNGTPQFYDVLIKNALKDDTKSSSDGTTYTTVYTAATIESLLAAGRNTLSKKIIGSSLLYCLANDYGPNHNPTTQYTKDDDGNTVSTTATEDTTFKFTLERTTTYNPYQTSYSYKFSKIHQVYSFVFEFEDFLDTTKTIRDNYIFVPSETNTYITYNIINTEVSSSMEYYQYLIPIKIYKSDDYNIKIIIDKGNIKYKYQDSDLWEYWPITKDTKFNQIALIGI